MRALVLAALLCTPILAQDVEFEFRLYEMEPDLGLALEDRLIAGGEGASSAMEKLPDFVRQGRVEELASAELTTSAGERAIAKSGDATLTLPTREAVEGLEVEVDPVVQDGIVDLNFYASFTDRESGEPRERVVTSQAQGRSGIPMLLCRWQRDDQWLLLTGTATVAGASGDGDRSFDIFYVESAYYASASSAQFGRDRLASTRIPCRSGQRSRSFIIGWIDDENILEDDQPGFRTILDPVLRQDGDLEVRVSCSYIVEAGGRTRLDSGERVRRLEIRDVRDSLVLKEGEPGGRRATVSALGDRESEEDDHVAAFLFSQPPSR